MNWHWSPALDLAPADRDRLLADALPGVYAGEPDRGPLPGGRTAALASLQGYDISDYGRSRNFMAGAVSRLSPYLRHGMLSITEVRDAIKSRYATEPARSEEFLRQLAWRDFFDKVLDWHGRGLDESLEEAKHGVGRSAGLPPDIAAGNTGLPCMDGTLHDLFDSGYLHNHQRLWFAAYLCHFRGVSWKAGARLFRQYLYDGDSASNNASWQWVESTFSSKPYFMNQENIAKFSGNTYCATCRVVCPFRASYEDLQEKLFNTRRAPLQMVGRHESPKAPAPRDPVRAAAPAPAACESVVWVHDAAISPEDAALKANPDAAVVFAFDEPSLKREPWAFHRLAFVFDGVVELLRGLPNPVKLVTIGDPAADLAAVVRQTGAAAVHVTDHPHQAVREAVATLRKSVTVRDYPRPTLAEYTEEPRRFSRYWDRCAPQVLGSAPRGAKRSRQ